MQMHIQFKFLSEYCIAKSDQFTQEQKYVIVQNYICKLYK